MVEFDVAEFVDQYRAESATLRPKTRTPEREADRDLGFGGLGSF